MIAYIYYQSILFSEQNNWTKITSQDFFDVAMGSYDGAETCEPVGSFILSCITAKYGNSFGLYRDDRLGVIEEKSRKIEQIKKDLCASPLKPTKSQLIISTLH